MPLQRDVLVVDCMLEVGVADRLELELPVEKNKADSHLLLYVLQCTGVYLRTYIRTIHGIKSPYVAVNRHA